MKNFNDKETHPNLPLKRKGEKSSLRGEKRRGNPFNNLDCFTDVRNDKSRHAELDSVSQVTPSSDTSCHLLPPMGRRKFSFGFTLAETLITLGIIGVVAALVVPGVVNGFRRKQLETAFKKADATITTAMRTAMFEHGLARYFDFSRYCLNSNCSEKSTSDLEEFQKTFKEQLNIAEEIKASDLNRKASLCNYWGTSCSSFSYNGSHYAALFYSNDRKIYILKDGTLVSELLFGVDNTYEIERPYLGHKWTLHSYIIVDTNGPYRGPNREGYDIFHYSKMGFHMMHCEPPGYNWGCYLEAFKDENPYDSSIGYWESLYRSKSWWEKVKDNSKK